MEFINYSINEYEYEKCGEIFMTIKGNIIFHCFFCEHKCEELQDYISHITEEHIEDVDGEQKLFEAYIKEDNIIAINSTEEKERTIYKTEISKNPDIEIEEILEEEQKELLFLDNSNESNSNYNTTEVNIINKDTEKTITTNLFKKQYRRKKINSLEKRQFKCSECDFSCKDKSNLIGHIKRHSANKPYPCSQCDKKFHTRTEMKAHFRRHTGERPFLCTTCGQTFFTSGILSAHVKRHKNIRSKECNVCHKKFFDAGTLVTHLRVHTGERPFQCQLCPSSFKRGNALVSHMKMHENKREFQCEFCPSRFNQKCNLNAHRKSKHLVAL